MNKKIIILTVLVICWMTLIFCFSNQPGDDSQNLSNGIVAKIVDNFNLADGKTEIEKEELIEQLDRIERKMAHYTIYLIGGLLIYADIKTITKSNRTKYALVALIIGTLYAGTDEIHQLFVNGRTGAMADVMLDTIGIATGITIYMLIYKIRCRNKKRLG